MHPDASNWRWNITKRCIRCLWSHGIVSSISKSCCCLCSTTQHRVSQRRGCLFWSMSVSHASSVRYRPIGSRNSAIQCCGEIRKCMQVTTCMMLQAMNVCKYDIQRDNVPFFRLYAFQGTRLDCHLNWIEQKVKRGSSQRNDMPKEESFSLFLCYIVMWFCWCNNNMLLFCRDQSTRITHTTYSRPMCYMFMLDRFLLHISDHATSTFHFNTYAPCNDYIHALLHVYYSVNSSIPVAFWGWSSWRKDDSCCQAIP